MLAFSYDYEDEPCPISDHALAKLHGAQESSLQELIDAIEPTIKPALAFFCCRRAHLETIGLAIAAACNETELASFGGNAGSALFARSRQRRECVQIKSTSTFRKKITLASGPMWRGPFKDDEVE